MRAPCGVVALAHTRTHVCTIWAYSVTQQPAGPHLAAAALHVYAATLGFF
jgi:hypothetical protein